MAPPFNVVSRYFFFACFALIVSFFILIAGNPSLPIMDYSVAGALHFYILGFVMSVILGALYQLIPVVLEAPFYSLKGSSWLFGFFALGGLILSTGMLFEITPMMHSGGSIIYIALVWFGMLFLISFKRVERWSIVTFFLLFASVWLIIGVSLGFFMIFAMGGIVSVDVVAFMVHHASAALIGFILFVVMGVSLVLLPMFSLSHGVSTIYSKISFVIINISLISSFFYSFSFMIFGIGVSIVLYILQSTLILVHRIRKKKDYWFYHVSFALSMLGLSFVLGIVFYFGGDESLLKASLWLFLVGFGFHFIAGHLYKILPFLIWYEFISPLVGKQKVPMLHEMINEKGAYLQLFLSAIGVLVYLFGLIFHLKILTTIGAICLLASSVVLAAVLYKTYKFKNIGELKC